MSLPSIDSLLHKCNGLYAEVETVIDSLAIKSEFVPTIEDIRHKFQVFYENKEFTDFEIRVGSNGEPIKVHKIYLIICKLESIAECVGQSLTIEDIEDRELIESLIHCFYRQSFDLDVNENNIEDLISVAEQLGSEELFNHWSQFKKQLESRKVLQSFKKDLQQKILTELNASLKRPADSGHTFGNKRFKPTESLPENECKLTKILPKTSTADPNNNNKQMVDNRLLTSDTSETIDFNKIQNENQLIDEKNDVQKAIDVNETVETLTTRISTMSASEESNIDSNTKVIKIVESNDQKEGMTRISESDVKTRRESKRNTMKNFDYLKLLKSFERQTPSSKPLISPSVIKKLNRSRSLPTSDEITKTFVANKSNNIPNYCFNKFVPHSQKTSTQVWKSRFVPKISNEDQLVVVVGGPVVKWFDLKQMASEDATSCEPIHIFESAKGTDFRSIGVTKINNPMNAIIYAIGSMGCIFVLRHPEQKVVTKHDFVNSVIAKDEEVVDIVFHIIDTNNYMICGTSEKNILVYDLIFNLTDLSMPKLMAKYCIGFPIISIVFIPKYNCLVASGESNRLILWKDILEFKEIPLIGKLIPNPKIICISSLVYIPEEDLICFRMINTDYLLLGQMDRIISKLNRTRLSRTDKEIALPFVSSAKLQHNKCMFGSELVEFIDIGYNSRVICCGDSSGNVYVYSSDPTIKSKGTVQPIQVISYKEWKSPPGPPIIRSVSISDDLKYLVVTTNQNMIGICRPITHT